MITNTILKEGILKQIAFVCNILEYIRNKPQTLTWKNTSTDSVPLKEEPTLNCFVKFRKLYRDMEIIQSYVEYVKIDYKIQCHISKLTPKLERWVRTEDRIGEPIF